MESNILDPISVWQQAQLTLQITAQLTAALLIYYVLLCTMYSNKGALLAVLSPFDQASDALGDSSSPKMAAYYCCLVILLADLIASGSYPFLF